MSSFEFQPFDKLLKEKYKAKVIDKQIFRDILYEGHSEALSVSEMTEGIVQTEKAVFYLISNLEVINKNFSCLYPDMYPDGKVPPLTSYGFCSFVLFVAGLSEDGNYVESYARWGSFADNIFDEMLKLGLIKPNIDKVSTTEFTDVEFRGIDYRLQNYTEVAPQLVKSFYYICDITKSGELLVTPICLPSIYVALDALNKGLNIYTSDSIDAYNLAKSASIADFQPEPIRDLAHVSGYFAHYHKTLQMGRSVSDACAFYGIPMVK